MDLSTTLIDFKRQSKEGLTMKAETVGDRVAWLRRQGKITQEQLAAALGVERTQISRIENGQTDPTLSIVVKLAATLGVDVHLLATGEELTQEVTEQFVTTEANEVARLLDGMDQDLRAVVVHVSRELAAVDEQRRTLTNEYGALLTENIARLEAKSQQRARLILDKISRGRG